MPTFSRCARSPIRTRLCLQPSSPVATRARLAALFLTAFSVALAVIVFAACVPAAAQAGDWTWMGGSNTGDQPGIYGTLGTPAASNFPGSRDGAISWIDDKGHLWLFGGTGYTTVPATVFFLNDLWEYHPGTHEWAWMGGSSTLSCGMLCGPFGVYGTLGVPASSNFPGSHFGSASWTDDKGNLWFFGGFGAESNSYGSGSVNDLWRFNPSKNEWTWMGGSDIPSDHGVAGVYGTMGTPAPGNIPGSRFGAARWTDSKGNFWLFGGNGYDANDAYGFPDDLWKFDPCTNEWTWMGGSTTVGATGGHAGVYGTLGTPAAGNIPGSRYYPVSWTDLKGHFWLFGGTGYDANGNYVTLNDLWEFNPSTKEWTWMGGSSTVPSLTGNAGVYGVLKTPAAGNIPGSRYAPASWTDAGGHLWLFGGNGYDALGNNGELNDLWEFNPATREWAWMSGSETADQAGVYGVLGTPAAGNIPGGREQATSWNDRHGNFWLLEGYGYDVNGNIGYLNDLWRYRP